jgi:pimeloyl-ACP methyl ester carboxylesterase
MASEQELVEKSFDTGEVVLTYVERPGEGTPLLLLHGGTLDWHCFYEFMPTLLSRSNPVYAPNFRGGGGSGWADSYRVIDLARDTEKFLSERIGAPVILIGFSTGASVALRLAATVPRLVAGAVLLEPPLAMRELTWDETTQLAVDDEELAPADYLNWVYETIKSHPTTQQIVQRLLERENEIGLPSGDPQAEAAAYELLDPQMVDDVIHDRDTDGFDIGATVKELRCPALLVAGEPRLGGVVRESDLTFFESSVDEGTSIHIPGVGHGVIWGEAGQEVLGHVMRFIDLHESRADLMTTTTTS